MKNIFRHSSTTKLLISAKNEQLFGVSSSYGSQHRGQARMLWTIQDPCCIRKGLIINGWLMCRNVIMYVFVRNIVTMRVCCEQ